MDGGLFFKIGVVGGLWSSEWPPGDVRVNLDDSSPCDLVLLEDSAWCELVLSDIEAPMWP